MSDSAEGQLGEPVAFGEGWQIVPSDHASFDFPGLEARPQLTYRLDFTHGEMVDPKDILAILFDRVSEHEGIQHGQLYANGLGSEERDVPEVTIARNMSDIQDFINGGMILPDSDGFTMSCFTEGHGAEGLHATFAQALLGEPAFLRITVTELPGHGGKVSDPVALMQHFTEIGRSGSVESAEETSEVEA